MKRSVLFTTTLVLIVASQSIVAQNNFKITVSATNMHPSKYAQKDIREFHEFKKDVRKFEEAIEYRDTRKAIILKREISKQMKEEIQDSKMKLKFAERNSISSEGLQQKYDRSNDYSKRGGNSKTVRLLKAQIEDQVRIYNDFNRMNLNRNSIFYKQAEKHHYLMTRFERTLKDDIALSFDDYRTERRYGK